jgi:3'-phosphoadenosine 5'-phosphosulfate (PAPS) 3'-phosphatase
MSRISLVELTKAAAILANRASVIVRHIHRSGNLNIVDKAENAAASPSSAIDPCTLADVLSQRLIAGSLRKLYPAIRVCGEEDENEDDVQQRAAIQAEPAVHATFPHLALPVLAGGVHIPSWIPLFSSSATSGDDDSVLETDITVWVGMFSSMGASMDHRNQN